MQVVMGVCEDIHVLDHGETIAHGTPEEVRQHPKVLAAYLGEEIDGKESKEEPAGTGMRVAHPTRAVEKLPEKTPLLSLKDVRVAYGGIKALKGIDLEVFPGEIVAMIGANGAGKTTTLKSIMGLAAAVGRDDLVCRHLDGGEIDRGSRGARGSRSRRKAARFFRTSPSEKTSSSAPMRTSTKSR